MNQMLPILRSSRLVLTPLNAKHVARLAVVAGKRFIADTTISVPHPLTEPLARLWIEDAAAETADGRAVHFAVSAMPEEDLLIGYVAIKAISNEHREGELSFWLDEEHGGKGYGTEAASEVLRFGFDNLDLNRICAYHMVRNQVSGRVLSRLGFTREGCLRQRVRKWGRYEDVYVCALLRRDLRFGEPML